MNATEEYIVQESVAKEYDRQHVWHAFAPLPSDAWMLEQADGVYVQDSEGKRYLDAMSGLWCVSVGYGQERIARRVYEQIMKLSYAPLSGAHEPAAMLANKLNEWLGAPYRIFFGNSGSEANETALKLARQYHFLNGHPAKYKVISRYRAYHGNTLGALSATGQQQRKYMYEPLLPGFIHTHPPDPYRDHAETDLATYGEKMAREIEQTIIWETPETVAAVIMEPIITGGGILVPPANYLPKIAEICRQYDVLLIIDEVISGFGRTGKHFAFQHSQITPDFVSMAKAITSAYLPLSATAVRPDIYELFAASHDEYARFRHVNTFGGHPVSCAAALENLAIFEEMNLVKQAEEKGRFLLQSLQDLYDFPYVGNIRGMGLLVGIELVADRVTRAPLAAEKVKQVVMECKNSGVIIGRNVDTVAGLNNVLTLAPPLVITEAELTTVVKTLYRALQSIL